MYIGGSRLTSKGSSGGRGGGHRRLSPDDSLGLGGDEWRLVDENVHKPRRSHNNVGARRGLGHFSTGSGLEYRFEPLKVSHQI